MLFNYLQAHRMLALVAFVIIFDLFLGVMRSFKEKKTNSTIGIDGMIRKVSMIACLLFLVVLDFLIHLDLIAWLPSQILDIFKAIGITTIGISDVFALLFIVFELFIFTSGRGSTNSVPAGGSFHGSCAAHKSHSIQDAR